MFALSKTFLTKRTLHSEDVRFMTMAALHLGDIQEVYESDSIMLRGQSLKKFTTITYRRHSFKETYINNTTLPCTEIQNNRKNNIYNNDGRKRFTDVESWPKKNCIGASHDGSCFIVQNDFGLLQY